VKSVAPASPVDELRSFVDCLEAGTLEFSPGELARAQAIVDALDSNPQVPDPNALARFISFGPGDWP
jgi:hypothetical protein